MPFKRVKHGNHKLNSNNGYMYNLNSSKGYNFNSHMHSCYEFIHILQGQLLYSVEGAEYLLSSGDLIITKPNELHSFSFPKECEYQREFLHIYPSFLNGCSSLLDILNNRKTGEFNYIGSALVKKYGIDKIFRGIEEYCESPIPETDFMVLAYTIQLITKINQIIRIEAPEPQKLTTNTKASSIHKYIDRHYRENIALPDIAAAAFMSPAYASRMFKKETGITIKSYLNLRRITRAKNLIMEGRKATSIYSECGFSDYSTFYRAFVKYAGMTPDEFKTRQHTKTEQLK